MIDGDPDAFKVILNWLRRKEVMMSPSTTMKNVAIEAKYYGLTELEQKPTEMIAQEAKKYTIQRIKRRWYVYILAFNYYYFFIFSLLIPMLFYGAC